VRQSLVEQAFLGVAVVGPGIANNRVRYGGVKVVYLLVSVLLRLLVAVLWLLHCNILLNYN